MNSDTLNRTWEQLDLLGDEPILFFYSHLFAANPHLRRMFGTHMREQRAKLRATLRLVVHSVDDLDAVTPQLHQLGQRHRDLGVTEADYALVAESLLETLAVHLGSQCTAEVIDAWTQAYKAVVAEMLADPSAQRAPVEPVDEGATHG